MLHRIVILLVSVAFVSTALAQTGAQKKDQKKDQAVQQKQQMHQQQAGAQSQSIQASKIMGQTVRNRQNQEIGEITDLVLDIRQGQVKYAVMSFGGFLGMGDKLTAIPYDKLQTQVRGTAGRVQEVNLILNVEEGELRQAPSFEKNEWEAQQQRTEQWSKEVDQYWEKATK